MPFLDDPFKHDIFVSYSHGAFEGVVDSHLKKWSQKFAEDLREELAGSDGFADVSIFLDECERSDESVDRTADLTNHLKESVVGSALLMALMTPKYLESNWCLQEFDWWTQEHHPDSLGTGGRLFLGRVLPSDDAKWPVPISEKVGYWAYDRSKETDKARPFTWRGLTRDQDNYVDLLVDLSGDMMQRLRDIKEILDERERQKQQQAKLAASAGQTLFLHARKGTEDVWDHACDTLQDSGFVVLPNGPVPVGEDGGMHAEHQMQLRKSDGLLLLGAEDNAAIDTDIIVLGRHYRREVIAEGNMLPCAVVNMVGPALSTKRRLNNVRNSGLDWIETTGEDLPTSVRSWLAETIAQIATDSAAV